MPRIAGFLAHLIGCVFALSCLAKLMAPDATLDVLGQVWHFPRPISITLFVTLTAVEAALALALITGWRPRWSLVAACGFLVRVSRGRFRQSDHAGADRL